MTTVVSPAARGPLDQLLGVDRRQVLGVMETMDADHLLTENVEVLVAGLMSKCSREEVSLIWEQMTRSKVQEVQVSVQGFYGDSVKLPHQQIMIQVPIQGDHALLEYGASQRYLASIDGNVSQEVVTFTLTSQELSADAINRRVSDWRGKYETLAEWANVDLSRPSQADRG